ncbi:MFS transporter [Rhodococcus spelaei]|uniref:MFS transporter n=1 Tax=Rhodococcus spelaei TaxID=2546320 RepID=A0A541AZF2_9NOCA|nr:MFS transporter [Rhodococcus spelaei]TQF65414.1 MFS transporter [Rhodococcus spelaei]
MLSMLRTRGMPVAMIMGFAAFGGWSLLLPVVPLAIFQAGGSDVLAGASTSIFMATTVATQLVTPRLLRAWGYRAVLAVGCVLLGAPALAFLLSTAAVPALVISAVRGVGFGMLSVAGSALVAELAPRKLLGRATGAQGIAIATGQMIALPVGLALFGRGHQSLVFVLGAVVPLLAVAAVAALPTVRPAARSDARREPLPLRAVLVPCLAMVAVASVYGGVSSLLPIAVEDRAAIAGVALAFVSGAMLVGRYGAGILVDRIGVGRIMAPALACVAVGAAVYAAAVAGDGHVTLLLLGSALFGAGFGAVQNEALVTLFQSAGPVRLGAASAAWNISYDAGTGIGALALGVVAGAAGYPAVFVVGAAAIAVVVPLALAWRIPVAVPRADRVES